MILYFVGVRQGWSILLLYIQYFSIYPFRHMFISQLCDLLMAPVAF
jgi:hypothetical protein